MSKRKAWDVGNLGNVGTSGGCGHIWDVDQGSHQSRFLANRAVIRAQKLF